MAIVTKVEVDKAGERVRTYHHRTDPRDPDVVTHTWTHPYKEKCVSCTSDRLPDGFKPYVRPREKVS